MVNRERTAATEITGLDNIEKSNRFDALNEKATEDKEDSRLELDLELDTHVEHVLSEENEENEEKELEERLVDQGSGDEDYDIEDNDFQEDEWAEEESDATPCINPIDTREVRDSEVASEKGFSPVLNCEEFCKPIILETNRRSPTGNFALVQVELSYMQAAKEANKAIRSLNGSRSEEESFEEEEISSDDEDFEVSCQAKTSKVKLGVNPEPKRTTRSTTKQGGGRGKKSSGKKKGGRKGNNNHHR